jgi:hypothetical protein
VGAARPFDFALGCPVEQTRRLFPNGKTTLDRKNKPWIEKTTVNRHGRNNCGHDDPRLLARRQVHASRAVLLVSADSAGVPGRTRWRHHGPAPVFIQFEAEQIAQNPDEPLHHAIADAPHFSLPGSSRKRQRNRGE